MFGHGVDEQVVVKTHGGEKERRTVVEGNGKSLEREWKRARETQGGYPSCAIDEAAEKRERGRKERFEA